MDMLNADFSIEIFVPQCIQANVRPVCLYDSTYILEHVDICTARYNYTVSQKNKTPNSCP